MYREMLDTPEQFNALVGQLIRIECGPYRLVGTFERMHGTSAIVCDASGRMDSLRVIGGTYAAMVTTANEILNDGDLPHSMWIRWRNRHLEGQPVDPYDDLEDLLILSDGEDIF